MLGIEHSLFGAPGSPPFLPSDFFALLLFFAFDSEHFFFEFITQVPPGEKTVGRLQARLLAFDFDAGRFVTELNTGGGFIDLLPAFSRAANKLFRQIGFTDMELFHAFMQLFPFFLSDHEKRKSRPNEKEQRQKFKFRLASLF